MEDIERRDAQAITGKVSGQLTWDANTRAVFGDYISIYDIQRAVADKATVPIDYESRI